ncbi:MAG: PAS domain-containing protein, partial [Lysinibacillus sp.]
MEPLLTEDQFHKLFDGKDFVYYLKRRLDDYEYIFVNNSAAKFLEADVKGKVISDVVNASTSKLIINKYNEALETNSQVDFEDYAYFKSEVRKYETTVRASMNDSEHYILAITKEINYDRNIEDKYLFMRSLFGESHLLTVVISCDGEVYEANPQFISNFDLTLDEVKHMPFIELPIIPAEERASVKEY